MKVTPVDRPDLPPLEMPAKFRTEVVFFMTCAGDNGAPAKLGADEYWIDTAEAKQWLDDFMVSIVSPLDAENKAQIELSDDHERFLEWLVQNDVHHVRLER